jgi:hypothetical protein
MTLFEELIVAAAWWTIGSRALTHLQRTRLHYFLRSVSR